ncbi:hypothetical protein ACHAWF_008035 [Thalassiosira exigua]
MTPPAPSPSLAAVAAAAAAVVLLLVPACSEAWTCAEPRRSLGPPSRRRPAPASRRDGPTPVDGLVLGARAPSCGAISSASSTDEKWPSQKRMNDYESLGEMTQMAHEHLEMLSTRDLSAFWTQVSKLLRGRNQQEKMEPCALDQLKAILLRTLTDIQDCSPRDLTQVTLALAKIITAVENHGGMPEHSPHRILHNRLIGKSAQHKQFIFGELTTASMPILPEFDERCLSNLIYAFGLVKYVHVFEDGSTNFDHLAAEAVPRLGNFNAQDMSDLIWAYATAKMHHKHLFKAMADGIVQLDSLRSFEPQHFSNIVWAFATMGESHPKLSEKVAHHIVHLDNLMAFDPQALSKIVWAYATAGEFHQNLFESVAHHIVHLDNLMSFKPQDLSNIVWAYATVAVFHRNLFERVADHIVRLDSLRTFNPQNLSNTVWAYATAEETHPKLFKKVADHIVRLDSLRPFEPQNLSNTVWAYATAVEYHPKLFEKFADHIVQLENLRSFDPQAISNTVWAYATAGESHPKLFEKVSDHIVELDNLRSFVPQSISNILWAYATAKESNNILFQRLSRAALRNRNAFRFNSQFIANFLWAAATYGHVEQQIFKTMATTAASLLTKCNEQELSNLAWAYAVAEVQTPLLFNHDFINICLEKEGNFTLEALRQLHQWNLWQEELESNLRLPPSLQEKCYQAFVSLDPHPSAFQDDVVLELSAIGLDPEEEVLTKSGYRLDALVEVNGHRMAVEMDGPTHFLDRRPTGNTIMKRRQVTKLDGFQVIPVLYWEWSRLKKDRGKKQQYLCSLLGLTLQDDVVSELSAIGLNPEEEVLTKSGYRLDALVEVNGSKTAVEVDGPTHFFDRRPTGNTILKRRQVTKLDGFPVISVPYWEWNRFKHRGETQQYLCSLLGMS